MDPCLSDFVEVRSISFLHIHSLDSPLIREKIIQEIIGMRGSIDTFRRPHPNAVGYTWGENQRHNKRGSPLIREKIIQEIVDMRGVRVIL